MLLWANLTRIWVCVIGWPRSETRCAESANLSPFPACRSPPLPSLCQYQNPLSIRCLRNMETGKLDRRQTFGAEQGFPALLRKMICQGVEERLIGILGSQCVPGLAVSGVFPVYSPAAPQSTRVRPRAPTLALTQATSSIAAARTARPSIRNVFPASPSSYRASPDGRTTRLTTRAIASVARVVHKAVVRGVP